jgi:hypothetical protein
LAIADQIEKLTQGEVLTPERLGGLDVRSVVEQSEFFNMLVYGESGVGKTTLAGSCVEVPEMRPAIFLDIEGGTLSLRDRYPEVEKVRIDSWDDLVEVYKQLSANPTKYKTVVLDSISELQEFGMDEIMFRAIKKAEDEGDVRDPDLPSIGEHGKSANRMRKVIRRFRDLPMNTIYTALERVDIDPKRRKFIKPQVSPKLSGQLAGFLDIVLYLYKKEVDGEIKRVILSSATDEVTAKDRTNRLPETIVDPTMSVIYDYAMRGHAENV